MKHHYKIKKAFTLAEVLITLGIIGIVAALTFPMLINNYNKQVTVARLKKAYSALSQVFVLSVKDNGEAVNWVSAGTTATEESMGEYIDTHWIPYLKVLRYCNSAKNCGYRTETKYWNGNYNQLSLWQGRQQSFLTVDGMLVFIRPHDGALRFTTSQYIFVDINAGAPPNVYGKDIFVFVADLEKPRIVPLGYNSSDDDIDKRCFSNTADCFSTCAARIMKDGWTITYW